MNSAAAANLDKYFNTGGILDIFPDTNLVEYQLALKYRCSK